MRPLHIIMPVKDSLDTTREALACLYTSQQRDWSFTLYNDFSTPENTAELKQLALQYGFTLVNWEERTTHPSPNYLLTLQDAQDNALQTGTDLLVIESDVMLKPDTISKILAAKTDGLGMIAAVTNDTMGNINFPYLYAKKWPQKDVCTEKRFSFCCTMLTQELLQAFPFSQLDPEKNWFDVTISHKSIELGLKNLLLMNAPVVHKPHSSRPWKLLKYSNPIKYYILKLLHGRDKI